MVEAPSSDRTMPNTKPPQNLTPVLCQRLQLDMLKACQEVAARHGLVVEAQDITGVDLRWGFDAAFRVSIPLPDGSALDPERLRFEALAEAFGFRMVRLGSRERVDRERPNASQQHGPSMGWGVPGFDRFAGFAGPNQPGKPQPTCCVSQPSPVSNIQKKRQCLNAAVPTSRGLVGDVRQTFSCVVRHRPRSRRELVKQSQ